MCLTIHDTSYINSHIKLNAGACLVVVMLLKMYVEMRRADSSKSLLCTTYAVSLSKLVMVSPLAESCNIHGFRLRADNLV